MPKVTTFSAGAHHQSHGTPSQTRSQNLAQRLNGEHEKKLKHGDTEQGDCIYADHYTSSVPGRLEHIFGWWKQEYNCGTLFVYHATGKIFNFCQFSTNAFETVSSKNKLEQLARDEEFGIKSHHSNNGVLFANEFKDDYKKLE